MTEAALARFHQGLAFREDQRMEEARMAIAEAATLAPNDARIALANAHQHFDTWRDAIGLFERALAMAPGDPGATVGLAAALDAEGLFDEAQGVLERAVAARPAWIAGHQQLARMRVTNGAATGFDRSFARACAANPDNVALRLAWFQALVGARDWTCARRVVAEGIEAAGPRRGFDLARVFLASESDEASIDPHLFDGLAGVDDVGLDLCRVRFWLRTGRVERAATLAAGRIGGPAARHFWPYLGLAWRLADDARSAWLEGEGGGVAAIDLRLSTADLTALAGTLRGLLTKRLAPPEQSVRGGTQTDRHLFFHPAPAIQALRRSAGDAVRSYIAALPPADPLHPLLSPRRDRVLYDGSWSVLLRANGHHAPHTHNRGWISSALHVSLPDAAAQDGGHSGWLAFGTPPPELGIHLPPTRLIEPHAGWLVLFGSTTWHRTMPFDAGERLTVAFDVRSS